MKIKNIKISQIIDIIALELEKKDKIEWEEIIRIFGDEDSYYEFSDLLGVREDYEILILCPRKGESGGALPIDELLVWEEGEDEENKINPFTSERTKEISAGAELTKKEINILQKNLDELSQQSVTYGYHPHGDRCCVYRIVTISKKTVLFARMDWSGEDSNILGFFNNEKKIREDLNKTHFLSS